MKSLSYTITNENQKMEIQINEKEIIKKEYKNNELKNEKIINKNNLDIFFLDLGKLIFYLIYEDEINYISKVEYNKKPNNIKEYITEKDIIENVKGINPYDKDEIDFVKDSYNKILSCYSNESIDNPKDEK